MDNRLLLDAPGPWQIRSNVVHFKEEFTGPFSGTLCLLALLCQGVISTGGGGIRVRAGPSCAGPPARERVPPELHSLIRTCAQTKECVSR